jgi:hypothetical protein
MLLLCLLYETSINNTWRIEMPTAEPFSYNCYRNLGHVGLEVSWYVIENISAESIEARRKILRSTTHEHNFY